MFTFSPHLGPSAPQSQPCTRWPAAQTAQRGAPGACASAVQVCAQASRTAAGTSMVKGVSKEVPVNTVLSMPQNVEQIGARPCPPPTQPWSLTLNPRGRLR